MHEKTARCQMSNVKPFTLESPLSLMEQFDPWDVTRCKRQNVEAFIYEGSNLPNQLITMREKIALCNM